MNKVQIFSIVKVDNAKSPYRVKWRVAGHDKTRAFKKKALAEKFHRDLHSATERGEHFSSVTGEPESLVRTQATFASCAAGYVAENYNQWQPASRRSTIQALTHAVLFLNRKTTFPFSREFMAGVVRQMLLKPNSSLEPEGDASQALAWIMKNSVPLQDLSPEILHSCLSSLSKKLDGITHASATTLKKRKQALFATLQYGVAKKLIYKNPLLEVNFKVELNDEAIDPKSVLTPDECRDIQSKLKKLGKRGLVASVFVACMWLAGLRPSEVLALRPKDIYLNEEGTSEIIVSRATVEVGKAWTDDGTSSVTKQPKSRRKGHARSVPIPSELVAILRPYISTMDADHLLFPGPRSKNGEKPISLSSIEEIWARVRTTNHKLYDLRHTNATVLIYSGLNVAEVASRLGHSIAVCTSVYLGVLDSQQGRSNAKVDSFLAGEK